MLVAAVCAVAAATALYAAPSTKCYGCYLVVRSSPPRIDRAVSDTDNITSLPWNETLTISAAAEITNYDNVGAVLAIAQLPHSDEYHYVWGTDPVRLAGCPAPESSVFIRINISFVYMLRHRDGALFSVKYNSSLNRVQCLSYSMPRPAGVPSATTTVVGVAHAFKCLWYALWRDDTFGVESPQCNRKFIPVYSTPNGAKDGAIAAGYVDIMTEMVVVAIGDPARATSTGRYAAAAQSKTSFAGKLIGIYQDGNMTILGAGLCAPTTMLSFDLSWVITDRGTTLEDEITEVSRLPSLHNFGWPLIEGRTGMTVFTRQQSLSKRFVSPRFVEPINQGTSDVTTIFYMVTGALVAVLCVGVGCIAKHPMLSWPVVVLWTLLFAGLMAMQIPGVVYAAGYNGTATTVGVVQSGQLHAPVWAGALVSLSAGTAVALVGSVSVRSTATNAGLGIAAGLLGLHVIVLAGGIRPPWKVGVVGWIVGAGCLVGMVGAIVWWFRNSAHQYRPL